MRRAAFLSLTLSMLAACGGPADDDVPRFLRTPDTGLALGVDVEPRAVALMEDVRVTLDLWVPAGREAELDAAVPDGFVGEANTAFEREWEGGTWRRDVLRLRPTEVGDLEIPAFEARSGERTASTEPVPIEVRSALDAAPPELADPETVEAPAPPFPLRTPLWPFVAGGAVLLALIAALLLWRRRAPAPPAEAIAIPPHVRARRALARLRGAELGDAAAVEAFYVEVSQVLRVYLEGRFGLHAPERTTEEFLPEVEQSGVLDAEQRLELARFLEQCDLVKFAAMRPGPDVHARTLAAAEALVEATAPDRMEGAA